MTYTEEAEPCVLRENMFLTQVQQLLELQQVPHIEILETYLVSPGILNGTERWKLEPLAEIWEGVEPEAENHVAYVYVLTSGVRYVNSALVSSENELLNRHQLLVLSEIGTGGG